MKTKLLLVDDEKEFVDTLAERLEMRNFSTTVAYTGESALEILANQSIDVVILDVVMPGLSGIDALKRIRKLAPLTQVIMLTGNATVANAIQGMKSGAYDFLLKPADTDLLLEKISQAHALKEKQEDRIRKAEIETIINRQGW